MSRRLRRAGGLFITLALVLLIMPVRADAPVPPSRVRRCAPGWSGAESG